jgi:2,3,4,5-tetrahydropyridine-2-carboxylate N-succinyltransferase
VLDVYFPQPVLGNDAPVPDGLADLAEVDVVREVRTEVVVVTADLDAPPDDAADAYLRLHLLSHRLLRPHGCSLDGLFGLLSNVVWTTEGPCAVEGFEAVRTRLRSRRP